MNDYIGVWPTDRDEPTPDSGVGVDTLVLRGPTTEALAQELRHQRMERDCDRSTGVLRDRPMLRSHEYRPVGLTEARVRTKVAGGQILAYVELSLPDLAWGHNCIPMSLQWLPQAADAVLSYLGEELPGIPALHETRVTRIDLTRDFHGLGDPSYVLEMLDRRTAPTATSHYTHKRPDGHVHYLAVGSSSRWTVRAYDKQHEVHAVSRRGGDLGRREFNRAWAGASAGQLRCEAELRTPVLTQLGLLTIDDCTPGRLERVAMDYFGKAGWDQPYGGSRILDKIRDLEGELTPATYRNLALLVLAHSSGISDGLSRHARESARALARRHRLLEDTDGGASRRLDFASGREVLLQESGA